MAISDTTIKAAKPRTEKAYKLPDEKGLHILITPNGSKYFRFKYRFDGKEKTLALGVYPETTLKQAREKLYIARKQIADGIDPNEFKKDDKAAKKRKAANTFETIAREWGLKKCNNWLDKSNTSRVRLEQHIFPLIGNKPIIDILPWHILECIQKLEERGVVSTAHRTLRVCGQVFRYAVATGRAERDLTTDLRGALAAPTEKNFAAITDPQHVGALLRAIDSYKGSFVVRLGLQLAPLVFVRPSELRLAEWAHIDIEAKEWRYFVTKKEVDHIVPLSTQAIAILTKLRALSGGGRFVFPSARTPDGTAAMSIMALSVALRGIGYSKDELTVHGFRAMARTILDEVLGFRPDFIEHQLSHKVRDANGRAYNRTSHLPERHKMMQSWADYLDGLKNGAQVITFKKIG